MSGEDQTDKKEDARLAERAAEVQNIMPFYESEPDIPYANFPSKAERES